MKALIDADILVYQYGFSAEKAYWKVEYTWETETGDGKTDNTCFKTEEDALRAQKKLLRYGCIKAITTCSSFPEDILENAKTMIRQQIDVILELPFVDGCTLFLTGNDETNFRYAVATIKPYKGNRKGSRKPKMYHEIREHLITEYDTVVANGIEADDALGSAQTETTFICSIDKDLNMIPGWHYNFTSGKVYHISEEEGYRNFYTQMITGDTVDNVPGIKGMGKVKAAKALAGVHTNFEMHRIVKKLYIKANPDKTEEEVNKVITEIGTLLWIRRWEGAVEWHGFNYLPSKLEHTHDK